MNQGIEQRSDVQDVKGRPSRARAALISLFKMGYSVGATLTGLGTVDDENVQVRQKEHVAHASLHGHGLHGPRGRSVGDPHAATSLLAREEGPAPFGNSESAGSSTSADENLH